VQVLEWLSVTGLQAMAVNKDNKSAQNFINTPWFLVTKLCHRLRIYEINMKLII
jgi:hypothetical protein